MSTPGEADLSAVGRLLAEPARARALMALSDGRWLPASMLALEAGVAASTMSGHLTRLVDGGLLTVRQHGRYRYYRLAGAEVAELVEVMAKLAPTLTIASLRQHTRAHALRRARRCYDHLGGRIAVAITAALIRDGFLIGSDDRTGPSREDEAEAPGAAVLEPGAYTLTDVGAAFLHDELKLAIPPLTAVRCCVDWTEHRHHTAGRLGRELLADFESRGWLASARQPRVLTLSAGGRRGLAQIFGIEIDDQAA